MTTLHRFLALVALAMAFSSFAAPPADAQDVRSWQREIAKTVASKQVYPRSALRREIEGSAKVLVTIERSGAIASFEMIESTGHEELDREVPKLIERIDPLPAPPSELPDDQLTFILPLAWILQ